MYVVLNQIPGEINFHGFTDAGQLRFWSATEQGFMWKYCLEMPFEIYPGAEHST